MLCGFFVAAQIAQVFQLIQRALVRKLDQTSQRYLHPASLIITPLDHVTFHYSVMNMFALFRLSRSA